jgi:hypothetical protein
LEGLPVEPHSIVVEVNGRRVTDEFFEKFAAVVGSMPKEKGSDSSADAPVATGI